MDKTELVEHLRQIANGIESGDICENEALDEIDYVTYQAKMALATVGAG